MEQLEPGWLSLELSAVEHEIEAWAEGLKESFLAASTFQTDKEELQVIPSEKTA